MQQHKSLKNCWLWPTRNAGLDTGSSTKPAWPSVVEMNQLPAFPSRITAHDVIFFCCCCFQPAATNNNNCAHDGSEKVRERKALPTSLPAARKTTLPKSRHKTHTHTHQHTNQANIYTHRHVGVKSAHSAHSSGSAQRLNKASTRRRSHARTHSKHQAQKTVRREGCTHIAAQAHHSSATYWQRRQPQPNTQKEEQRQQR